MVNSFNIGPISIHFYALFVMMGIGFIYFWSSYWLKKAGYKDNVLDDLFIGGVVCGLIIGRLWFVVFHPNFLNYLANPISIIEIWNGGLAIQGGVLGAVLFFAYYAKKHKLSLLRMLDVALPAALVGQAIGRWGNFFNQEAFGPVVDESFFNLFPTFIKEGMYFDGNYHMPMFLFECVANIIAFVLIYTLFKKLWVRKRGDLTYFYLLTTGIIRFFIEIFRTDSLVFLGLKSAQVTSVIYVVIALLGLFGVIDKVFKKSKPTIVFDLDGTLVNTKSSIYGTFNMLMKKYNNREMSESELDSVYGPSLDESFSKYFPDRNYDELLVEYREYNQALQTKELKTLNNAQLLIDKLKNEGYPIAIFSNKNHAGIEFSLELVGLRNYFDVILGVDDVKCPKPNKEGLLKACNLLNTSKDNLIYVGDSVGDMLCAHNAGAYSIAVAEPIREVVLANTNPNKMIKDLLEIEEILKENKIWTYNMM
ncbi:MAG: prolipoprotein diacylglyceryl transferase [Erysipelotrichaceae bacterium]